jgi:O-antigen ligase
MPRGHSATAERWLRLALVVVATLLAAPLGYIATLVLLTLLASAAVGFVFVREMPPGGTGVSVGLAFAALILLVVAAAGTTASPADLSPLLGFSALLFYAGAVRLAGEGAAPGNARRLADCALGGAALGLLTALAYSAFGVPGRAAEGALLDDPTRLATTSMILGFLALMGLPDHTGRRRYLYLLGPLFGLAVALLAGSRDALLAFPALVLVAAFALPERRRLAMGLGATAVVVGTVAVLLLIPFPGRFRASAGETLGALLGGGLVADAAVAVRLKLYAIGWQSFLEAPFAGHGWAHVMEQIHPQMAAEEQAYGAPPHLHSDALQFAAGAGLLGLAAFALILLAPIAAIVRGPRDGQFRARAYGLAVLAVGFFVMGLFDTMLAAPLSLTLFVTLMALIGGWCRDGR